MPRAPFDRLHGQRLQYYFAASESLGGGCPLGVAIEYGTVITGEFQMPNVRELGDIAWKLRKSRGHMPGTSTEPGAPTVLWAYYGPWGTMVAQRDQEARVASVNAKAQRELQDMGPRRTRDNQPALELPDERIVAVYPFTHADRSRTTRGDGEAVSDALYRMAESKGMQAIREEATKLLGKAQKAYTDAHAEWLAEGNTRAARRRGRREKFRHTDRLNREADRWAQQKTG